MRTYKNWAHKISSWEYVTIWRPVLPVFLAQRCRTSALHPELLQWVLRSAATAARDLILAEVDGKQAPRTSGNLWLTSPRPVGRTERETGIYYCGECVCVCVCVCVFSLDKRGKLTLKGRPSSRQQQEAGWSFLVDSAHHPLWKKHLLLRKAFTLHAVVISKKVRYTMWTALWNFSFFSVFEGGGVLQKERNHTSQCHIANTSVSISQNSYFS